MPFLSNAAQLQPIIWCPLLLCQILIVISVCILIPDFGIMPPDGAQSPGFQV